MNPEIWKFVQNNTHFILPTLYMVILPLYNHLLGQKNLAIPLKGHDKMLWLMAFVLLAAILYLHIIEDRDSNLLLCIFGLIMLNILAKIWIEQWR